MRFSDEQLQKFYDQYVEHVKMEDAIYARNEADQKELRRTLQETTEALDALTESISDMMVAWNIAQGAWRFTGWLGSVVKWVAGVAIAAGTIIYVIKHGAPPK